MPDITDLSISELTPVASAADTDLFETSEVDGTDTSGYVSKRISLGVIADFIGRIFRFPAALTTTDKTIVGAINEVKADAGSDVSVTNTIPSSNETKRVATVTVDGTPTDINADDTEAILRRVFGEHIVEGNPVTFDAYLGVETVKSLTLTMNPIQSGTGEPSPTNIRPISGRDSVDVVVTGKNQYIGSPSFDGYGNRNKWTLSSEKYDGNEVIQKTSAWEGAFKECPVENGKTYTFSSMVKLSANATIYVYNASNQAIKNVVITTPNTWIKISATFTANSDYNEKLRIETNSSTATLSISEYQLEEGSTATDYAPFIEPKTKTITFPSTIYGGTDEIVGGNGTEEYGIIVLDDSINYIASGENSFRVYNTIFADGNFQNDPNVCSSWLLKSENQNIISFRQSGVAGNNNIYLSKMKALDPSITDVASFKTYMGQHPLQVCYRKATPASFSTTPTNIPLNKGNNVVSSDADDLELKYSVG